MERIFPVRPTLAVVQSLSLTSIPSSFTPYFEKLYEEISLSPFENYVPISRKGKLARAMKSLQMLSP